MNNLNLNWFLYGNEFVLPDYEKALEKYEKAYEMNQGDSEVLFMLGLMYSYGVGCELDDPKVQRKGILWALLIVL